jgi:hypothetical protein
MAELPHPWDVYLRLQKELDQSTQIDDRNHGLEGGLNSILNSNSTPVTGVEDIARAVSSDARRERHRLLLRRKYSNASEQACDTESMLECRSELRKLESVVNASDWNLLVAVANGREYHELGSSGKLRIRVTRLRKLLRAA